MAIPAIGKMTSFFQEARRKPRKDPVETLNVTILDVEKNPGDSLWMESIIPSGPSLCNKSKQRFRFIPVPGPGEARARLKEGGVDVVLFESRGTNEEDMGALSQIKAASPNVPIIVLSDVFQSEALFHLMENGVQEYLVKGQITGEKFCRAVWSAIERQRYQIHRGNSVRDSIRYFDVLMEMALDGVAVFQKGVILTANLVFDRILGYEPGESKGKPLSFFFSSEYQGCFQNPTDPGTGMPQVIMAKKKEGSSVFLENKIRPFIFNKEPAFVMGIKDITEHRKTEESLRHQAYWDFLTDLPNRYLFFENLNGALKQARKTGNKVALFFIDLDHFKVINDTLGHHIGDQLLKIVSKRLSHTVRLGDTVARLGGDEFTIIFQDFKKMEELPALARKIHEILEEPININQHELHVTASIGISIYPDDAQTPEKLTQQADVAMYKAKENGRNDFSFYQGAMDKGGMEKLDLQTDLHHAFNHEEFNLVYQPQVDMEFGKVVGLEALLRWNHPVRGPIPPAEFIPLTEETGLIVPLGQWILRKACAQNKAWQDMGLPPVRMAVNLSAVQFFKHTLPFLIDKILKETGLEPKYLELEITEGTAMRDPVYTLAALREMTEIFKLRITLDDFGVAYSSLGYLKQFPMNCLKIDKSFVDGIGLGARDDAIVSAIIRLAQNMGLEVVAEGVETEQQLGFLKSHRCTTGQGYYFHKPLAAEQVESLLRNQALV